MQIACSIESKSKHPIANSFNRYQKDNNLSLLDVNNFASIAGKGLKGEINNITYFVGKETLFPNQEIKIDNKKMNTTVIIGTEEEILGIITLKDKMEIMKKPLNQ